MKDTAIIGVKKLGKRRTTTLVNVNDRIIANLKDLNDYLDT
jgi:hypothetical protein